MSHVHSLLPSTKAKDRHKSSKTKTKTKAEKWIRKWHHQKVRNTVWWKWAWKVEKWGCHKLKRGSLKSNGTNKREKKLKNGSRLNMKLGAVEEKTDKNCSMIWSVERKIREQLLWNLSINRGRHAREKKSVEKGKKAETQKESKCTHIRQRHREKTKKERHRQR